MNDRVGLWQLVFNEKDSLYGQKIKETFDTTRADLADEYGLDASSTPIVDNDSSVENSIHDT